MPKIVKNKLQIVECILFDYKVNIVIRTYKISHKQKVNVHKDINLYGKFISMLFIDSCTITRIKIYHHVKHVPLIKR